MTCQHGILDLLTEAAVSYMFAILGSAAKEISIIANASEATPCAA